MGMVGIMPSQGVLKKLFQELAAKSKPLVRYDRPISQTLEKGFDEGYQLDKYNLSGVWGEPTGIYYGNRPQDLGPLITGEKGTYAPANIQALPLPEARTKNFTAEEWQANIGRSAEDITKDLKSKYDFISFPDLNMDRPDLMQTVQLNPNKAIAKIKTDKGSIYKILGLAGALGIGANSMDTNTAEASPIGDILKAGTSKMIKASKGPLSSAARDLEGMALKGEEFQGAKIRSVTKGAGDIRNILLDNGDAVQVDKQYINDLARAAGKVQYTNKLPLQSQDENFQQALNGLQHTFERTYTHGKGIPQDRYSEHTQRLTELLGQNPDVPMVGVRFSGQYMIIPQAYADVLKGQKITLPKHPNMTGVLQIDKNPIGVK